MTETREIYCCGCEVEVQAKLISGEQAYPHRKDLFSLPFWQCEACGNFVGCHHRTKNRTKPLGVIPTPDLKILRMRIHKTMDPIWESGKLTRKEVYRRISDHLGWRYSTAKLRSVEEAEKVYAFVYQLSGKPIVSEPRPTALIPSGFDVGRINLRDEDPSKLPWE